MRSLRWLAALSLFTACRSSSPGATPPASTAAPQTSGSVPTVAASAAKAAPSGPVAVHAGQTVSLPNGGSGYLAAPGSAGASPRRPAILVIQEYWGLDDWMKSNADRFASQGYVAFAVDLYRGRLASNPDEAHELMRGLPEDRGIADIKAGFDMLAARPDVSPARIGIVGWCMGGGYVVDFATVEPRLRAAAVNYGHLFSDPKKIDSIHAAMLGNFGGQDRGIPPADVKSFADALKAKGKDADFKIYEPDGHAFMNPKNAHGYDESASKDAWDRIDAFFARTLKSGS